MITLLVVVGIGIAIAVVVAYVMYRLFKDDQNV